MPVRPPGAENSGGTLRYFPMHRVRRIRGSFMGEKKAPAVGIDLGTTHSVIAFLDNEGRPTTIRNAEGDITTPSVVFF